MNFQNLNFDHVETPRPWPPHFPPAHISESDSQSTIQPRHVVPRGLDDTPSHQSLSPQATVVPPAPSPPSLSDSSPEFYGPDRFFGRPRSSEGDSGPPAPSTGVRFDETQLAMFEAINANRMAGLKDELTIAAGKVTPGVDDTPYIQYALAALTGDQGGNSMPKFPSGTSAADSVDFLPRRRLQDEEMGYRLPPPAEAHVHNRQVEDSPLNPRPVDRQARQTALPHEPAPASPVWYSKIPSSGRWIPAPESMREHVDPRERTYTPLNFKPRILRPFSMMILMTLCILMTAALIFTTVYSKTHAGLTPYPGSIYSGQYFVFRILPSLLAAVILVYAQSIVTTSLRILPFAAMASEDPRQRYLSAFQKLYPKSLLWPQLVGPWQFKAFSVATWLAVFTLPLQSAGFACVFRDGKWIWASVQSVAWTLVALYVILMLSTIALMVFWFRRCTGLIWDIRSIADLVPLLNRSNTMDSYEGMDLFGPGRNFKAHLRDRWFDRLGYWRTEDMQTGGLWYAIGTSAAHADLGPKSVYDIVGKRTSFDPSVDSRDLIAPSDIGHARFRYMPWCLRNGPVAAFVSVAGGLLLALLVVSFLPQTRLGVGFFPLLPARPDGAAFSAANFLYSFLPSLLGVVLFGFFQTLDQTLRILQPWAELSKLDGGTARKSILLDYAACLPFQTSWKALKLGHWRVAVTSLMAVLFLFVPVLGGGVFMALVDADGKVRMYPSMPVFGVLLAFLFMYVGCLSLMIPRRGQFLLPHPVTCIADIISFCSAEDLTQDAAFRSVRSHRDLEGRLGVGRADPRDESVWHFGVAPGRDEQRLSVRRLNRFTEKSIRATKSTV